LECGVSAKKYDSSVRQEYGLPTITVEDNPMGKNGKKVLILGSATT
jgi:hypothetical protein